MSSTASLPPERPNPPDGAGEAPPVAPAGESRISPLGPLSQYKPGERYYPNKISVTGATMDDPSGSKTRVQILRDPDWASPLRGFSLAAEGYAFSAFTYWFAYGITLSLASLVLSRIFPGASGLSGPAIGAAVMFGPLFGFFLNIGLIVSGTWGAVFGAAMIMAEPVLIFCFFFASDWRERFRYASLTVALVILKALIYTLVNLSG